MLKKNQIKQMQVIYWSVFTLLLLVGVVSMLFAPKITPLIDWSVGEIEQFKTIVVLFTMLGVPGAFYLHNYQIKKIDKDAQFHTKVGIYKMGVFIKIIVIEVIGILSSVGFLITTETYFLYLYVIAFILYLYIMPISSKIHEALVVPEFDYDEQEDEDEDEDKIDFKDINFNNN